MFRLILLFIGLSFIFEGSANTNNNPIRCYSEEDTLRSGRFFYFNGKVYDSQQHDSIIDSNILEAFQVPIYNYILVRKDSSLGFGEDKWISIKIEGIKSTRFEYFGDIVYAIAYTSNDSITIDLWNKKVTKVPIDAEWCRSTKEIKDNSKIYLLDLSEQDLSQIPETVSKLNNLAKLQLYKNSISNFPIDFFQLKNLEALIMSDNQLEVIPKEIKSFINLQSLDFRNNQLIDLPKEIIELKNLQELDLRGNKFSKENKEKIKGWFKNSNCSILFDEEIEYLDEH